MNQITVSDILVYPIKSTAGLVRQESKVFLKGLQYDRRWAIVDRENNVLTAREHPWLLDIKTGIVKSSLEITLPGSVPFAIPLQPEEKNFIAVKIFGAAVNGNHIQGMADRLLSDYTGVPCRLIFMDDGCDRNMDPRHGGSPADQFSYADTAPVLLTSVASLHELNALLPDKISMKNFRPNIVITGCKPGEEDEWKYIRIGEILFEVSEKCKRCVLATVNPETKLKHADQEPLRTLAEYKRHPRGGVSFGVNLIPRSTGIIRHGDRVEIVNQ